MQASATGGRLLCHVLLMALTLTSAVGCPMSEVPGMPHLFKFGGSVSSCAPGTIFSFATCACVHGTATKKACVYEEVPHDEHAYREIATGKVSFCQSGLVFNILLCKCKPDPFPEKPCRPRFSLDFNANILKNKVIRYNVGGENTIGLNKGYGKFQPDSEVLFWTTQNRPFDQDLQLQLNFTDNPKSKAKKQVLLTNCDAMDNPKVPSLLVFLDKTKQNPQMKDLVRIQMRTHAMSQGVEVAVPFRSGEPNILLILKAMDMLKARIIYPDLTEELGKNRIVGKIITSPDYLRLGSCDGHNNGFDGVMDWFDYFPCWPKV